MFTCNIKVEEDRRSITTAIHLELVSGLPIENFLLALKIYIPRRGSCKAIYSDKVKTFKKVDQDQKEVWKGTREPKLLEFFSEKGITWQFIA